MNHKNFTIILLLKDAKLFGNASMLYQLHAIFSNGNFSTRLA